MFKGVKQQGKLQKKNIVYIIARSKVNDNINRMLVSMF